MSRPLRFLLLSCILFGFSGCVPADQLDWRISAKTPNQFNEWREVDLVRLPPEVQQEFNRAFNLFAAQTPGAVAKDLNSANNALCRRIHGRSIRGVLIEAYGLEQTSLLSRISSTSDNMLQSVKLSERTNPTATEPKWEEVRHRQAASIATMEQRLAEIKDRLAQLARRSH